MKTEKRMETRKNRKRSNGRKGRRFPMIAAALLAFSGISAGLFSFTAELTTQAGLKGTEKVSTSYHVPAVSSVPEIPEVNVMAAKEGKEDVEGKTDIGTGSKANYQVSMSSLKTEEPTSIDLTMEQAAALGIKYLEDIMDFDAEGVNVYMSYSSGTITFPRAFWSGDVRFGKEVKTDEDTWSFFVDAVTGELFMIGCTETLDVDVPLGYDSSLETNYGIYAEAAKELAERCNLVDGPVADVKYSCQGYSSNNPDITVKVEGSSGRWVTMVFSRYNQRFLGLSTDTSDEITEKAMGDFMDNAVNSEDMEGAQVQFSSAQQEF
ncbi:MAG: hypothetical protein HFI11_03545 [Lachnospiraceae bacterium]|nr:hypothetical protein [Lachnospiraceae bacterium]